MIVVADTSPLNYLVLIDEIELLPALFGRVLLPPAVYQELTHPKASLRVSQWAAHFPTWPEVRAATSVATGELTGLDPGEREAIQLAVELGIRTALIDEADGRQLAERLHLDVRGTLGILERAAKLGKVNFRDALTKLEQTNFRISPGVRSAFLKRNL